MNQERFEEHLANLIRLREECSHRINKLHYDKLVKELNEEQAKGWI